MSFLIKLNQLNYKSKIKSISSACNNITSELEGIPTHSCQSETLNKYYEEINEITSMIQDYKELVNKDIQHLSGLVETMTSFEKNLLK